MITLVMLVRLDMVMGKLYFTILRFWDVYKFKFKYFFYPYTLPLLRCCHCF